MAEPVVGEPSGGVGRETYTLGYDPVAVSIMASRTARSHAAFFLPHLQSGLNLLDAGCGPGAITAGFVEFVAPGQVRGIEVEPAQVSLAQSTARERGLTGLSFDVGDLYALPAEDGSVDRVHIGAVLMNLRDPERALREVLRVLKPGGAVGIREADQGGDLMEPADPVLIQGMGLYTRLRQHNGHDPFIGRRLRALLHEAGFERIDVSATYESYGTPDAIQMLAHVWAAMITQSGIAQQILALGWADRPALDAMASACARFAEQDNAFVATAWCEAVAWKPL